MEELLQLLKTIGGSAPGMENWQPTPTDLSGASQQNARAWVGVKPALAQEGTAPRLVPKSYSNPRVFEVQGGGGGLRQIGGPLMGLMSIIVPALLGHNPWQGLMDLDEQRRIQRLQPQYSTQPPATWDWQA